MKTFYLFIFLFVFTVGQLIGQTDTTMKHLDSSTEQKEHHFGIGLGLIYNSKPQLIYSPDIHLPLSKYFNVYIGPSFLIPLDTVRLRHSYGFRIGTNYSLWNKKIKPTIKLEFSRIKYEFNSVLYDYAVPNIPVKATVLNQHKSFGFNLNSGINYCLKNRFFISGDVGVNLLWERNIDPGTKETYMNKEYGEEIPLKFSHHYTFSIETGIYF